MMNEKELREIASSIEKYVSEKLVDGYSTRISENPDEKIRNIMPYLKRLANRSREYNNQSFVVLVVGPVKSGKSTFVNLVANEYVSPTHFLECTGRPSIISKGDSREITIYRSKDTQNKAGQIEDIFDSLNGLIQKDEIANVDTQTVELNKENIESYVKLDLNNDDIDETLITSITTNTDAGGLLQDNVLLVDMAGFDGAKVNMDNTPYEKIVERADVIIFVQSSNSAISKVATEFFDIIKKHNTKAPICLIHNIFDSAYWRPDDLKKTNADEHIQYAVDQFRSIHHLPIDESRAFNVNLGKVSDLRSENYQKDYLNALEEAQSEFKEVEQKIAHFFTSRGIIHMQNCITKNHNKLKELMIYVEELNKDNELKSNKYTQIETKFKNLGLNEGGIKSINLDKNKLKQFVIDEYNGVKHSIIADTKYKTITVRNIATNFIKEIHTRLEEYFKSHISSIAEMKNSIVKESIITIQDCVLENKDIIGDYEIPYNDLEKINIEIPKKVFVFNHKIDLEILIPKKFAWKKWKQTEINSRLEYIYEFFNGKIDEDTHIYVNGYIEKTVIPDMEKKIQEAQSEYKNLLIKEIKSHIENVKQNILERIIPNNGDFVTNRKLMTIFYEELSWLNDFLKKCEI